MEPADRDHLLAAIDRSNRGDYCAAQ